MRSDCKMMGEVRLQNDGRGQTAEWWERSDCRRMGKVRLQDGGRGQTARWWERSDCRMMGEVRLWDDGTGQIVGWWERSDWRMMGEVILQDGKGHEGSWKRSDWRIMGKVRWKDHGKGQTAVPSPDGVTPQNLPGHGAVRLGVWERHGDLVDGLQVTAALILWTGDPTVHAEHLWEEHTEICSTGHKRNTVKLLYKVPIV